MEKRKGARSVKTVDKKILKQLNEGLIETVNMVEMLAMDFHALAKNTGITSEKCTDAGVVKKMQFYGSRTKDWKKYASHTSDTVRGFAAYALATAKDLSLEEKLTAMKTFADDTHFGVREWAWIAIRPEVSNNLKASIKVLEKWSKAESENVRRFASEVLRPRGVWCSHINELKQKPELAVKILKNLNSDGSKYVRDSVGNWLNDAAKTQPKWVKTLCAEWKKSKNSHTDYIIKKALRSL